MPRGKGQGWSAVSVRLRGAEVEKKNYAEIIEDGERVDEKEFLGAAEKKAKIFDATTNLHDI